MPRLYSFYRLSNLVDAKAPRCARTPKDPSRAGNVGIRCSKENGACYADLDIPRKRGPLMAVA